MAVEHGVWTMYGMDWDDPYRIRSCRELINWINEIGFLPFFKNEMKGSRQRSIPPTVTGGQGIKSRIPGNGVKS